MLGWTDLWGGDAGEKVKEEFAAGAKQARDLLGAKRLENKAEWDKSAALANSGQSEAAQLVAWQAQAYGEELRDSFGSWLNETLDAQLTHLLATREAALLNGTNARRPAAIQYDMAPRRDSKAKGKGEGKGKTAVSGGKGPTARVEASKKVIKAGLDKSKAVGSPEEVQEEKEDGEGN